MYPAPVQIHLTFLSPNSGKWLVACTQGSTTEYKMNGVVQYHPLGSAITGDPRAVTCPMCKRSEAFKVVQETFPK